MKTSWKDWLMLTKPRIIFTVSITSLAGILLSPSPPHALTTLGIVAAIALVAAGAAVWNNVLDRDLDATMPRTATRPLARGAVQPSHALWYGSALCLVGLLLLLYWGYFLSWLLSVAAFGSYVGLYTAWLKRKSPFAAVPGGIAGALPPLIGAAAATGTFSAAGLYLFAFMLVWQPAHFWYLSFRYQEQYHRAGVPVLIVAKGEQYARLHILLYACCLLPLSLLPYGLGVAGSTYLLSAFLISSLCLAANLWHLFKPTLTIYRLFPLSILQLLLLLLVMVIDKKG